jgi:hypothetical protein
VTEVKVTISPSDRWEDGVGHDSRAEAIMSWLKKYDDRFCGGEHFEMLQTGGDGDQGEELLYLLDEYFAAVDSANSSG